MRKRIWDRFSTEADQNVFRASGTNATLGFGAHPVLLVVDVTYAYSGHLDEPILDSIAKWPNGCGPCACAIIIRKAAPSALFDAYLRSYLTEVGADTVVACGA